ncbi:MAG TPA: NAD-dependent deacylase [Thermoanaerobaculia bacterium]|nr:NAD-dependent deacylase [Thermoanaerobaculia bacterium]HUM30578.1 NAD-dependent deacylase [Thermoanaerobaculia bacterium]HXK68770.1 NAD-dependent deacylase [Thermoanaerobaculia bacterium]
MTDITKVRDLIRNSKHTVVLTGAGISAESGVPTFRGTDGLWRKYRPEELATPEAFHRDPLTVWEWYQWRRGLIAECHPNAAHQLVVSWEKNLPHVSVVTQNVDGLHRLAGSTDVMELHGNIWEVRCTREGTVKEDRTHPFSSLPPLCSCGAMLRPNVVWFGESLPSAVLERAFEEVQTADLCIVIGTSSMVQPAASLPYHGLSSGARVIEVNPQHTPLTGHATVSLPMTAVQFAEALGIHEG